MERNRDPIWRFLCTLLQCKIRPRIFFATVEIKKFDRVTNNHLKGSRAFKEELLFRCILISRDPQTHETEDGILILPWQEFLKRLWSNKIIRY